MQARGGATRRETLLYQLARPAAGRPTEPESYRTEIGWRSAGVARAAQPHARGPRADRGAGGSDAGVRDFGYVYEASGLARGWRTRARRRRFPLPPDGGGR